MKQSNALASLRQLCCSGLSKEMVIAEFLRAVPMLIPSNSNTFSISNDKFFPTYSMSAFDIGDMADTAPGIIANFHTTDRQNRAIDWFSKHSAIIDARVMDEAFYMTDLYNLIYRQFDMYHVLWAPIVLDASNTGVLGLYRSRGQKSFDIRDQEQLIHLLPYLSHAWRATENLPIEYCREATSGMMIMDAQGAILYQSPEAKALVEQARYPKLLVEQRKQDRLLMRLTELCRNLQNIYRGQEAPPPSYLHTGPNGQFLFRAYWLNSYNNEPGGLIGMTIEHRKPLKLKILRALRNLPLSPMQQEVALFLAEGATSEQICKRMHIKPTTVKDHVGKIYMKLDIHQREELLPKLLASEI
ncbi:MAG: helix-turn-helix transcriptional regulator [Methylococcaceae bacterium]|nr:helix-turn-helix transcriptional regulator [Methylococcaceae bacterium]